MDKNDIIEYVMHTPHNTNRAVLSSMLNQLAEGGDSSGSWAVLTEESVTIVQDGDFAYGNLSYSQLIDADTIRVTFNGTEYECDKQISTALGNPNLYGASMPESPIDDEWGEYPFRITSGVGVGGVFFNEFDTETAGTYTIKIEAPQSGGSSDFSTATMTVSNIEEKVLYAPIMDTAPISPPLDYIIAWGGAIPDGSYQVVLYKGNAIAQVPKGSVTLSGNIESLGNGMYLITGDCTITIDESAEQA